MRFFIELPIKLTFIYTETAKLSNVFRCDVSHICIPTGFLCIVSSLHSYWILLFSFLTKCITSCCSLYLSLSLLSLPTFSWGREKITCFVTKALEVGRKDVLEGTCFRHLPVWYSHKTFHGDETPNDFSFFSVCLWCKWMMCSAWQCSYSKSL